MWSSMFTLSRMSQKSQGVESGGWVLEPATKKSFRRVSPCSLSRAGDVGQCRNVIKEREAGRRAEVHP